MRPIFLILLLFLTACQDKEANRQQHVRQKNLSWQPVRRLANESRYQPLIPPVQQAKGFYPWEEQGSGLHPKITKEFFRCRGNPVNPPITYYNENGNAVKLIDCGGIDQHSLPVKDGQEFIFSVLIDLLNFVQEETKNKVVITSGHRCPAHHNYATVGEEATSKHMIGAEVDFYVEGLQEEPEKIVELLTSYYKAHPETNLNTFQRYSGSTNVSTLPWFNKEVFIKLFRKEEGRNLDNRHPYSYLSIQVRWDQKTKSRVSYNWNIAHRQYHRW